MTPPLNILCVNSTLGPGFKALGHNVVCINPKPGVVDIQAELAKHDTGYDLLFQEETLGPRVLLKGLAGLGCKKAFWSLDTHLNFFWHVQYAKLFDMVFTTQKHWVKAFERHNIKNVQWLPWYAVHPVKPGPREDRSKDIAFVGRITPHRQTRAWFVQFLASSYPFEHFQDVSFEEQMEVYEQTRIVPNESIFGEINFRTFEGASRGCCLVNQDVAGSMEELFAPEKEILLFSHVLDLKSHLDRLVQNPEEAEELGANAYKRVMQDHLAEHRANTVASAMQAIPVQRMGAEKVKKFWWMTAFHLWQAGRMEYTVQKLRAVFLSLPADPEVLCALLELAFFEGEEKNLTGLLTPILLQGQYEHEVQLNTAATCAALRMDDIPLARQFWYRYCKCRGMEKAVRPEKPADLYLLWAKELAKREILFRPGFLFDPDVHIPATALECLLMAREQDPDNLRILKKMDRLLAGVQGLEPLRLTILSHISLHEPQNWRIGLELALVNFKAYRLTQGLEELIVSLDKASSNKKEQMFFRELKRKDPSGHIRKALAASCEHKKGNE